MRRAFAAILFLALSGALGTSFTLLSSKRVTRLHRREGDIPDTLRAKAMASPIAWARVDPVARSWRRPGVRRMATAGSRKFGLATRAGKFRNGCGREEALAGQHT